jgi:hypothetical protein
MENLYIIKCNDFYKIGVANDLGSRLASLQTGNPYPLVVIASFEYPNAGFVERALHQAFAGARALGEWFKLGEADLEKLIILCKGLGGIETGVRNETVNEQEIEEAETIQEEILDNPEKWDYKAMFADGWRMEKSTSKGVNNRYWCWRRGGGDRNREYIYGGLLEDLLYPIEEMRHIYRNGGQP